MDHRRIEEMNIPDLYTTGRLSAEDEEAFETHLLECRQCREQVAWADDFGESLRSVAIAEATEAARASVRAGLLAWLSRRPIMRMALTAVLLVLAALPAGLLAERSGLRSELARARAERPALQEKLSRLDQERSSLAARLSQLDQERNRLVAELGRERGARTALANRLDDLTRPQVNTPVFSLGVVRGSSEPEVAELGPDPEFVLLSLDLPAVEQEIYRATLYDAKGARITRFDNLEPTSSDTLRILVYSELLKPGDYRVVLEGIDNGHAVPAGSVPFRVRKD